VYICVVPGELLPYVESFRLVNSWSSSSADFIIGLPSKLVCLHEVGNYCNLHHVDKWRRRIDVQSYALYAVQHYL